MNLEDWRPPSRRQGTASGKPNPHTKTGRKQLARRARRYGYFWATRPHYLGDSEHVIQLRCPLCREWVVTPEPKGERTIVQALDRAVISHLEDDCRELHDEDVISA